VTLGHIADGKLALEEVHRFGNIPMEVDGFLQWDFQRFLEEIYTGIAKAFEQCETIESIAVDSWGVDYGLLDASGCLMGNPCHYRDSRTDGMMEKVFAALARRRVYDLTGIQFMQLNTLYQLMAARLSGQGDLAAARHMVFFADLVAYHLCGEIYAEYTLASTSQLLNMNTGEWADEVFEKLDLPRQIMPPVVRAGRITGQLTEKAAKAIGVSSAVSIVAAGSHDTASAVAAIPAIGENWAYLSCGTWSLMGVELPDPVINDATYKHQFTNEGGVCNTIRMLKNIMGLWLLQESRRQWKEEGCDYTYAELAKMAEDAEPFVALFNVNDSSFLMPGGMPDRINDWLDQAGQRTITSHAQLVRVILESLAIYYRWVLEKIEEITGKHIEALHIVGGGCQNKLLCQFSANALNRRVIAGPVEATAMGNIMLQALAMGQVSSLAEVRQVISQSIDLIEYQPCDVDLWQEAYAAHNSLFDKIESH
jgi:sugar (pentulose or hexulose) kinase